MITSAKLEIYSRYNGDADMWDRIGTSAEKLMLAYEDWKLIESLIQDLNLNMNVKVSKEYQAKLLSTLERSCDNGATIKYLTQIAFER